MKILCICDQGNNRSVTFAHLLKYWGNDTLSAGMSTNSEATLVMLGEWADKIVLTEEKQLYSLGHGIFDLTKVMFCDVGPDTYPRPFNKELLVKAKQQLELHRVELQEQSTHRGKLPLEEPSGENLGHGTWHGEHSIGCSCPACTSKYEQSITR